MATRRGWGMTRVAWLEMLAATVWLGGPVQGQEGQASVRIPNAAGEPGEEVELEFRATFAEPLLLVRFRFEVEPGAVAFVGVSVADTAAAHAAPRGVGHNPSSVSGGWEAWVRFDTQSPYGRLEPGNDLVILKARLQVLPGALEKAGGYRVSLLETELVTWDIKRLTTAPAEGFLTVQPPRGPRPVGELSCAQQGSAVRLDWSITESYATLEVHRNGQGVATLPGSSTSFLDEAAPVGAAVYSVIPSEGGHMGFPADCSIIVQTPRPPAVTALSCADNGAQNVLGWSSAASYESIEVHRNGRAVASLPGNAVSYTDDLDTDLLTVYTVTARLDGVGSLPVSCRLNELSETFVVWAEEVRAEPGDRGVAVRIFGTNPETAQAIQLGLGIDKTFAAMRELTVEGTAVEAAGYDQFLYQLHNLPLGETACGIYFDTVPPYGQRLTAGADQHLITVIVDIPDSVPGGTAVQVDLGTFGIPALGNQFTVDGASRPAEPRDGWILIGASPVAEVQNAQAEPAGHGGGQGAAAAPAVLAVQLTWRNADAYTALRIERDGLPIAALAGDAVAYLDPGPGPGLHRYRIIAVKGEAESFPVVITSRPPGGPGTFRRGDANVDAAVNIADAVLTLRYLFLGGPEPGCLDAADTDDNGRLGVTDVLSLLFYLFAGVGPLPEPGAEQPWFDPTADDLGCE